MGAAVIATSSSNTKLEIAKRLGATELINYTQNPEWADEVLRLTHGRGVDLVVEVGGAGAVEQSVKCFRDGGMVSLVGFLTESTKTDLIPSLLLGGKTCKDSLPCFVSSMFPDDKFIDTVLLVKGIRGNSKAMLQEAVNLTEDYDPHPVMEQPFKWEDAHEAYKALKGHNFVGKIVINV
jgi:NADPH:quinone reductase-like Zn-dependent oxidoreductase